MDHLCGTIPFCGSYIYICILVWDEPWNRVEHLNSSRCFWISMYFSLVSTCFNPFWTLDFQEYHNFLQWWWWEHRLHNQFIPCGKHFIRSCHKISDPKTPHQQCLIITYIYIYNSSRNHWTSWSQTTSDSDHLQKRSWCKVQYPGSGSFPQSTPLLVHSCGHYATNTRQSVANLNRKTVFQKTLEVDEILKILSMRFWVAKSTISLNSST